MAVVINRVYTKTGDAGTTRLAGGQELEKDALRIETYGTVDELNAVLGVACEHGTDAAQVLIGRIRRIQNELFDLGGTLATLEADRHQAQPVLTDAHVEQLEREIDEVNATLAPLRSFILPGGGPLAAQLHVARTVCRRAERRFVSFHRQEPQRAEDLKYLNRLSDWLFVMSREAARLAKAPEVLWKPGGDRG